MKRARHSSRAESTDHPMVGYKTHDNRYFGRRMAEAGKRVWPGFSPYSTRHWFATQFLIANDFRVYPTAKRLGDTVSVTEKWYLDEAKARSEMDRQFRMPRFRRMSE